MTTNVRHSRLRKTALALAAAGTIALSGTLFAGLVSAPEGAGTARTQGASGPQRVADLRAGDDARSPLILSPQHSRR